MRSYYERSEHPFLDTYLKDHEGPSDKDARAVLPEWLMREVEITSKTFSEMNYIRLAHPPNWPRIFNENKLPSRKLRR